MNMREAVCEHLGQYWETPINEIVVFSAIVWLREAGGGFFGAPAPIKRT